MDYQKVLKDFKPRHEYFIGIDSDGCVFDTMEAKQKEFFIPIAMKFFDLHSISKEVKETWEFVNLYSIYRGGNRFTSLVKVFELLQERKRIAELNFKMPDLSSLKKWINAETKLSNHNLHKYLEHNYSSDLEKVVRWTEEVNREISEKLRPIPPFPHAGKAIETMSVFADLIIVSQTPLEALEREWKEHDLEKFVSVIAGQEHGTKTEHIALTAKHKYPSDKILMIGDAIGDLDAARSNGILFYPVMPGREEKSWQRFLKEGFQNFITGQYKGNYETSLIAEFENSLPRIPSWTE